MNATATHATMTVNVGIIDVMIEVTTDMMKDVMTDAITDVTEDVMTDAITDMSKDMMTNMTTDVTKDVMTDAMTDATVTDAAVTASGLGDNTFGAAHKAAPFLFYIRIRQQALSDWKQPCKCI